jgi:hypothetical protein
MTSIDLRQNSITVEELLHLANNDQVVIIAADGREFVLEEADDFEKEVIALGRSEKFVDFLKKRAQEPATTSLDEVEKELLSE